MRARGHLIGGIITGAAVAGIATLSGDLAGPRHPNWWGVAATGVFFALFPDVDTDSLPRRWFYRVVVLGLLYLAFSGQERLGLWLALIAMLPLLDHHRGWTHGRWMPLVVPALLGAGYLLTLRATSWEDVWQPADLTYYAAAVFGWYTHLLLDGLFRLFPPDPD